MIAAQQAARSSQEIVPPLKNGDRLDQKTFHVPLEPCRVFAPN